MLTPKCLQVMDSSWVSNEFQQILKVILVQKNPKNHGIQPKHTLLKTFGQNHQFEKLFHQSRLPLDLNQFQIF